MSRLANDCFAETGDMISANEAFQRIAGAVTATVETEARPLTEADGRILGQDILSDRNVPPADNAAVDGYAFNHADYAKDPLRPREVAGRSAAGRPLDTPTKAGELVKILTGALMPEGFDTVAMIEDVTERDGKIILPAALREGDNCRKAGEDIKTGQRLLSKGHLLRPQDIGYLASIGISKVPLFRRVRVALFSTGDELCNPGDPVFTGSIYDSNRYILAALLRRLGCEVSDLGILEDHHETVRAALAKAAEDHDLVVTSGGVSMGDEDHVKAALNAIGHLNFWRIAIKPGRPLALGQIGDTAFVGLPGNPIAAFICCLKFVHPLIKGLGGGTPPTPLSFQAKADFSLKKKAGRTEWLRGKYHAEPDGTGRVEKYYTTGSGILTSVVWANGLIEIGDEVTHIDKGDLVTFLPFSELMT